MWTQPNRAVRREDRGGDVLRDVALSPRVGPFTAIATMAASPNVGTRIDLKVMCVLPIASYSAERRRIQSDLTELAPTQTAAWPWVRAGVASSLNYAPDRR
jgi:hypothetical protein